MPWPTLAAALTLGLSVCSAASLKLEGHMLRTASPGDKGLPAGQERIQGPIQSGLLKRRWLLLALRGRR